MKLKGISKQLKYYYKNYYGKGLESNNDRFNLIAGQSGMDVSSKSEMSLDELRYDDDQSGDNDGSSQRDDTGNNSGSKNEVRNSQKAKSNSKSQQDSSTPDRSKEKVDPNQPQRKYINTKITECIENSSFESSDMRNSSHKDIMDVNTSGEIQHAFTLKNFNAIQGSGISPPDSSNKVRRQTF